MAHVAGGAGRSGRSWAERGWGDLLAGAGASAGEPGAAPAPAACIESYSDGGSARVAGAGRGVSGPGMRAHLGKSPRFAETFEVRAASPPRAAGRAPGQPQVEGPGCLYRRAQTPGASRSEDSFASGGGGGGVVLRRSGIHVLQIAAPKHPGHPGHPGAKTRLPARARIVVGRRVYCPAAAAPTTLRGGPARRDARPSGQTGSRRMWARRQRRQEESKRPRRRAAPASALRFSSSPSSSNPALGATARARPLSASPRGGGKSHALRAILARPCVFWLAQRADTRDKIRRLGPLPRAPCPPPP